MASLLKPVITSTVLRNITKLQTEKCLNATKSVASKNYMLRDVGCQFSSAASNSNVELKPSEGKMCAWQIHSYGGIEELQLSCSVRDPVIAQPDDVVVNVQACSVNPIDVNMMNGYGATLLNKMRQVAQCTMENTIEFPLTLGRDFAGQVVAVGHGVSHLKPGDEVWGVVAPHHQGCHSQRVVLHQSNVRPKPSNLSMEETASIPYAAVTAWSALRITGDLLLTRARGKKILILGASGGVGSISVQMARAWGAEVVGTCRTDAVPFVESLGASAIDYTQPDSMNRLRSMGQFDIVLDAAGVGADAGPYTAYLREWSNAKYITLSSPLLKNMDEYGLVLGTLQSAKDLLQPNITSGALSRGSSLRWGYFLANDVALDEIQLLMESGKIAPCIQRVYPFTDMMAAFKHVMGGHLRGKIVVSVH